MTKQQKLQQIIDADYQGQRLDLVLSKMFTEYSRSKIQSWLKQGLVMIDQQPAAQRYKVKGGESVELTVSLDEQVTNKAQAIQLDIIYEDDDILVINKPIGLVVHPGAGVSDGTLLNALLHHHQAQAQLPRAGIVHRLDKDTSGLLIIAKTLIAHTDLVRQLQARSVKRQYLALVHGTMITGGTIEAPIGRHPRQRTKMAIVAQGKPAITHYRIKQRFRAHTLLQVNLETGRTHQIRVHFSEHQHPLVGDKVYGGRAKLLKGCDDNLRSSLQNYQQQALHAQKLAILHPTRQQLFTWQAPLPDCFQQLLALLRDDSDGHTLSTT